MPVYPSCNRRDINIPPLLVGSRDAPIMAIDVAGKIVSGQALAGNSFAYTISALYTDSKAAVKIIERHN